MEFTSTFALLSFMSQIGEQSSLTQSRPGIRSIDSLIAGAALFETLFNKKTIGQRDEETSTSILVDSMMDEYLFDMEDINIQSLKAENEYLAKKFINENTISEQQQQILLSPINNIIVTFDFLNLIGWKYHESQQKPKKRGTAEFKLADVVSDINEKEEVDEFGEVKKIKYGVLIDDGDKVIEKDK